MTREGEREWAGPRDSGMRLTPFDSGFIDVVQQPLNRDQVDAALQ